MLGCQNPSHHIFLAINIRNPEVEHLHKFEQGLPNLSYACRIGSTCHRGYAVGTGEEASPAHYLAIATMTSALITYLGEPKMFMVF